MAFAYKHPSVGVFACSLLLLAQFSIINCQPTTTTTTTLAKMQKSLTERIFMTESGEVLNESEMQTRNCHSLCGHCDCMGFYCVEECICECNGLSKKPIEKSVNLNETKVDTECLAIMQKNAKDLQLPFELLIQGPNANRIVRTALHMQDDTNVNQTENAARNKRSTIVIYTPAVQQLQRNRRAVRENNLDWFNELTHGLMRPTHKKQQQQQWPILSSTANMKKIALNGKNKNKVNKNELVHDTRRSSKNSKPTALYKLTSKKLNSKKPDPEIYNESMEYETSYKSKQPKQLVETDLDYRKDSAENLADIFYTKPMKVLDQMPAAVRDAIRRIRNHEPMKDEEIYQKLDMDEEQEQENSEEEEQQNYAEILHNLHEQLLKNMEQTKSNKSKKSKMSKDTTSSFSHMNKVNVLQRLREILDNQ